MMRVLQGGQEAEEGGEGEDEAGGVGRGLRRFNRDITLRQVT